MKINELLVEHSNVITAIAKEYPSLKPFIEKLLKYSRIPHTASIIDNVPERMVTSPFNLPPHRTFILFNDRLVGISDGPQRFKYIKLNDPEKKVSIQRDYESSSSSTWFVWDVTFDRFEFDTKKTQRVMNAYLRQKYDSNYKAYKFKEIMISKQLLNILATRIKVYLKRKYGNDAVENARELIDTFVEIITNDLERTNETKVAHDLYDQMLNQIYEIQDRDDGRHFEETDLYDLIKEAIDLIKINLAEEIYKNTYENS